MKAGEADGLPVLKLDRLSRSTRDVLDLVDESRRQGWRLVSVSENLDTGTAAGRLVLTVLAALSEMERKQIGDRRELKPHQAEQAILGRMVALRDSGLGTLRIARQLGTNPRTGRPWNRGGVASVLDAMGRRVNSFADHAGEGLL